MRVGCDGQDGRERRDLGRYHQRTGKKIGICGRKRPRERAVGSALSDFEMNDKFLNKSSQIVMTSSRM